MFYFDLSFNKLTGTIPEDIGEDFVRLRQIYLNNNALAGPIPESLSTVGNGQLYSLHLNDNQLTGAVPSSWIQPNVFLDTIRVQNNQLTETIDKNTCKLGVLDGGEMVELSADCEICSCDSLCDKCY